MSRLEGFLVIQFIGWTSLLICYVPWRYSKRLRGVSWQAMLLFVLLSRAFDSLSTYLTLASIEDEAGLLYFFMKWFGVEWGMIIKNVLSIPILLYVLYRFRENEIVRFFFFGFAVTGFVVAVLNVLAATL